MFGLRNPILLMVAFCSTVATAQESVVNEPASDEAAADEPVVDEVQLLVRQMREDRAAQPTVDRTISVYSTHYTIGPLRFETLDAVLMHIGDAPPGDFPMTRLAECAARPRMEEWLARKAELDRAFLDRIREQGRSHIYEAGISAPGECPW